MEGFQPIAMWTLTGEQEDDWLQGRVGYIINFPHSILFEAKILKNIEGDIALDDIVIVNGYCQTYPVYASPTDGFTTPVTVPPTQLLVE